MLGAGELPMLGFVAFSGTGKTTLMLKMLPLLQARGKRVGIVKHAHRSFEIDHPGKDSYALRKSGAQQIVVGSRLRWALICEHVQPQEPTLAELVAKLEPSALDLILVEGFKQAAIPKIEVHRPTLGHPLLCHEDPAVVAVAHDGTLSEATSVPTLDLNDAGAVVDFIITFVKLGVMRSSADSVQDD